MMEVEEAKKYFDQAIEHWRTLRDNATTEEDREKAILYVDAFQSARTSVLGDVLPPKDPPSPESSPMTFTQFIRRPFTVEAVEVTEDNFDTIASMTGTIGSKEDGTRYIETNRTIVPNVFRIYVGFWVTRLDGNLRGYSAKTFSEMFQREL